MPQMPDELASQQRGLTSHSLAMWWQLKYVSIFTPKIGGKNPNWRLRILLKKWVANTDQPVTSTWRIIPVSTWLITMVIVNPLRIRLFPLQMAELYGL